MRVRELESDGLGVPVLNAHRRAFPAKSSAPIRIGASGLSVQSLTRNAASRLASSNRP